MDRWGLTQSRVPARRRSDRSRAGTTAGWMGSLPEPAIQCMVCAERSGATELSAHTKGARAISQDHRTVVVDQVVAGYETLMQRLADSHAPEFLEIDITMPQAKLLYLLGAAGDLHMSELVGAPRRVAVHRERARGPRGGPWPRDPPRRPAPIAARSWWPSRPPAPSSSTASASSTRARCASCSPCVDDAELACVRDALEALAQAAVRWSPAAGRSGRVPSDLRKDPS